MKKRFDEIDVMRIIGFLLVVDQHILGAYAQRPEAGFAESMVLHFLYLLGRPAVPMFAAITGFTLFYVNYNRLNIGEFYKKRFITIVMPYIFWSLASIVIFNKYYLLRDFLLVIATGNASYHLWYMSMSIRLYMWFPLISAAMKRVLKLESAYQKILLALFFIAYWALLRENNHITDTISALLFGTPSLLEKRLIMYSPVFWSAYFVCGAVASLNYEHFKQMLLKHEKMIIVTYIPVLLYMYYTQICNQLPEKLLQISYAHLIYIVYMLQTTAVVYIASVRLALKAERYRRLITELGSLSYGAYLVHVMILQKVAPVIRRGIIAESYLASGLLIFSAVSVLSFTLCYIIRFLPLSEYIIGVKGRQNKLVQSNTYSM